MARKNLAHSQKIALSAEIHEGCAQKHIHNEIPNDSQPGAYMEVTTSYKHWYDTFNVYCIFVFFRKLKEETDLIW